MLRQSAQFIQRSWSRVITSTCTYSSANDKPTTKDKFAPKKFERTPVGRLEEDETLNKRQEDDEGPPRRRIVNEETGEIGGPQGPEPTRYNGTSTRNFEKYLPRVNRKE